MNDTILRKNLIRLAHEHPEFRADLLPLITSCDHTPEAPTMGKYEEGVPADPTENMSEADKAEWKKNTLQYKDKFKAAGCEKLPAGGMRDHCEKKSEGGSDDETKKEAALRKNLIRLAHEHPEFRADLLPLLKG